MELNPVFSLAVDFVNNTSRSIFLTGKAGTGKTTFLRYIKTHTPKKCVVVAPTGVAAINAGGVTMHSFFQLPFGPFVPVTQGSSNEGITDKHTLFKNIRFSEEKRELLRDLQLLIIDEVSMVRSDAMDAIDVILRHFRKNPHQVFGGVQVLFIGDLFQLPPVMPDHEWKILKQYYTSEFFFHSKAIEQSPPIYLELKKIYRQNEQSFIELLNQIRNDNASQQDLETLNSRYRAEVNSEKKYITLTSHNYKADKINQEELNKLSGKIHEFKGIIDGDFQDKALPTDMILQLKTGAQVMFIRNDKSSDKRYFNGKIVTVNKIDSEGIHVLLDDNEELLLEKETWNNIRYSYNSIDEKIDEQKLGSFSQYPIRLAWAITIHKSQGLTFEHAIIDAGDSFAPGQVYVALSRCVSLDGIVLHSRIDRSSISTHREVLSFSSKETDDLTLEKFLKEEKHIFLNTTLMQTFDLQKLTEILESYVDFVRGKKLPDVEGAFANAKAMLDKANEQQKVFVKFRSQLEDLLRENDTDKLKDRVSKAIEYFTKAMTDEILHPIEKHLTSLKGVSKVKKYLKKVREVKLEVARKINEIQSARYGDIVLNPSENLIPTKYDVEVLKKKKLKVEKGSSLQDTLNLFKTGITIREIAFQRELALSTIESHIAMLVKSGDVPIEKVLNENKLTTILSAIRETSATSLTSVKQNLGNDYTFGEIKAAMSHLDYLSDREQPVKDVS